MCRSRLVCFVLSNYVTIVATTQLHRGILRLTNMLYTEALDIRVTSVSMMQQHKDFL